MVRVVSLAIIPGDIIHIAVKATLNAIIKSVSIDQKYRGLKFLILHPWSVKTDMSGSSADIETKESIADMIKVSEVSFKTGEF